MFTGLVLIVGLVGLADVAAQEPAAPAPASAPAASEAEIETAPVDLDGTVLFRVRGVSSLPAAERARLIHDRLAAVAADGSIPVDSLRVVDDERVSRIRAGDRVLLG